MEFGTPSTSVRRRKEDSCESRSSTFGNHDGRRDSGLGVGPPDARSNSRYAEHPERVGKQIVDYRRAWASRGGKDLHVQLAEVRRTFIEVLHTFTKMSS